MEATKADVAEYVGLYRYGSGAWKTRAQGRGSTAGLYCHGLSDNVLPIAPTSRVFVSSLRKNGYNVEFREFSGGHHVSRQVADQAMSWLITVFHERRSNPSKIDSRHS